MSAPRLLRAVLVDDEPLALRRLARMLEDTGRVTVVATFTDPVEALESLRTAPPDALFVDVSMPGLDGFALVEALAMPPPVVFTTAFDTFALRAFEVSSVDYLLKPVDTRGLLRALDKLERMHPELAQERLRALKVALQPPAPLTRLTSRTGTRVHVVELEDVTHLYAEDRLVYAVRAGHADVVDISLAELERRLDPSRWLRIHRATLVRLGAVTMVQGGYGDARAHLKDGTVLPVARDRLRELRERLGGAAMARSPPGRRS
ncbi:DNA-binding response regulator [Myxococcus stipitatus DSM 14675]|uniref:DNA-binding response regulator n=1 Tax=Myxococcus stipitatus (strain DSM 14675 / JCM 12634 / Mx s8) TaxID=1278073 RepID=L7UFW3_MYXSD|nr:LytTR family DNA-binding domain-containing protein [Myxococcus stipitatus]AGC45344.1 DNA-binding response regulator [Myxococcus stipitatus DSM 14675]